MSRSRPGAAGLALAATLVAPQAFGQAAQPAPLAVPVVVHVPPVHVNVPPVHVHVHSNRHSHGSGAGPDSARVAKFLTALAATDPIVCGMAIDQLGNHWGWYGGSGIGDFREVSQAQRAAGDSLGNPVTDQRALPLLTAGLGQASPCVRRASAPDAGRKPADGRHRGAAQRICLCRRKGPRSGGAMASGPPRTARPSMPW